MSRMSVIKDTILEVMEDGKEHTIREIRDALEIKGVQETPALIRSTIYKIQDDDPRLERLERGVYQMLKENGYTTESLQLDNIEKENTSDIIDDSCRKESKSIDALSDVVDDFILIEPTNHKKKKMVLSILKDGTIVFNRNLMQSFKNSEVEIWIKEDASIIRLNPEGNTRCKISKTGRNKNYHIFEFINERNIILPIYYVFEWDKEHKYLIGTISEKNPNLSKIK